MKRKKIHSLLIWKPTGFYERSVLRTIWRILSSPIFSVGIAVVAVAVMIYFGLANIWWMWAIAPSAICFAILAIVLRKRAKENLLISKRQAKKHNDFHYNLEFAGNQYSFQVDKETGRTQTDHEAGIILYRHLAEALVALGLFEETGHVKVNKLTGDEFAQIEPVELYTDFILNNGIGYILFMPSINLIAKTISVNERIISRTLREIGFIGWAVERVNYDDDIVLFSLKNEAISLAYDFCGVE
jgi:hypothetical protein